MMSEIDLGQRVKILRMRQGMTGDTLARLIGVSPSLISRIERGKVLPSLRILDRLANALRCSLSDLVSDDPSLAVTSEARPRVAKTPIDHMVVRKDMRLRVIHPISKTIFETLTPTLNGRHEIVQEVLGPGCEHASRLGAHPEGEETIIVLKGQCQVWVGSESTTLFEGDAITYNATLPHRHLNSGTEDAVLLAVITPPHVGI